MTQYLLKKAILWFVSLALICCCFGIVSNAQDTIKRTVHLGLLYPISTNGRQAGIIENTVSFNVLAGLSLSEDAFCLSGITSIIKENATGVTISGLYNQIGRNGTGLQLAGLANYTGNTFKGIQLSAITNMTQIAEGTQISGIANIASKVDGAQFSGVANIANEAGGVQAAGLINIAKKSDLQLSGLMNLSQKESDLQVAGFMNKADTVPMQIAGFLNVAKKVSGMQIAGFINIADESDYPIGIVNIIKNGEKILGVSLDEMGSTMFSLRSGGRVLYGLLGVGFNFKNEQARYVLEAGIGAHLTVNEYFRINPELSFSTLSDLENDVYFKSAIKLFSGLKLGNKIELFAGPSLNYMGYEEGQKDIRKDHYLWQERKGDYFNGLFIGATIGVHVAF